MCLPAPHRCSPVASPPAPPPSPASPLRISARFRLQGGHGGWPFARDTHPFLLPTARGSSAPLHDSRPCAFLCGPLYKPSSHRDLDAAGDAREATPALQAGSRGEAGTQRGRSVVTTVASPGCTPGGADRPTPARGSSAPLHDSRPCAFLCGPLYKPSSHRDLDAAGDARGATPALQAGSRGEAGTQRGRSVVTTVAPPGCTPGGADRPTPARGSSAPLHDSRPCAFLCGSLYKPSSHGSAGSWP